MLRIVLLTRQGRPSGREILQRLALEGKHVVGVIAEKRSSLLLKKGWLRFLWTGLCQHGVRFLICRAWGTLVGFTKRNRASLASIAAQYEIPLYVVKNHNSRSTKKLLKTLGPDLLITANTRIIQKRVLEIPTCAAINFHTSTLPQYAGLDSIFWALYYDEPEIGVTVHVLEPKLDTGNILGQRVFPVGSTDTVESLTERAIEVGAALMVEVVDGLERGTIEEIPQDLSCRSYFSWPTPRQRRELRRKLQARRKQKREEVDHQCG